MAKPLRSTAQGDGQYDAFVNALKKIYKAKKTEAAVAGRLYRSYTAGRQIRCPCVKPSLPGCTTEKNLRPVALTVTRQLQQLRQQKKC